jgi:signal transduction histidine kinase/ActR/RegA family two-component response regulator
MMKDKSIEETLQKSLTNIERAKQEWEATVDSLSQLVCLLDHQGRILRANWTVERWNLGRVVDVKGRKLCDLLHSDHADPACNLKILWSQAWKKLIRGQPVDYEIEDNFLGRYLRLQAQPISAETRHDKATDSFAVIVIDDITARKQAEEALRKAHDELERRVEERTIELSKANTALKEEIAERQWAENELKQRAAQLTLLNDIGGQIAAVLDLDSVLERTARLVHERFGYHHVALFTMDQEQGELVMRARAGALTDVFPADHRIKFGKGMTGWVWQHRQKLLANDVRGEPRYVNFFPDLIPTQSELTVPIQVGSEIVGVFDVQSPQLDAFDEDDVLVLETLADQIAVAIENARLYETVRQELTERKQAEKALTVERALLAQRVAERTAELSAANAELERAARLKDEFLANMSHELRTPLNTVLGMAEILNENVYGELNAEQQQTVSYIEESGRHLLALITDILDLAKIEAGKSELLIAPVAIDDVCQASLLFIKQTAQKKQIKVFSAFDNHVNVIQADERRLKQILVNLLSNAVKFTPEGGQVGLEVVGDETQGVVQFTIWDTGIGIAEVEMKQLFEPFVQIDSSLSRQHEGTGLGLSLVYRLTEMHGGSVAVESKVGEGSRFTVSLPWPEVNKEVEAYSYYGYRRESKGKGAEETDVASPALRASAPMLLLADDNEANIATLTSYLRPRGYQIVVARNGAEAIERAREMRPALILMDIQMPGMDGIEASRRLRADTKLAAIPIIALTALAMPGDRERCLEAGANEYLSKPVSLSRLVQMIETQLDGLENSGHKDLPQTGQFE